MVQLVLRCSAVVPTVIFIFSGCSNDEEKKISHFKRGQVYYKISDYKEARLEFVNAIRIDPRYLEANLQLAGTEVRLGDADAVYKTYRRVAELDPGNLKPFHRDLAHLTGRTQQAQSTCHLPTALYAFLGKIEKRWPSLYTRSVQP